MDPREALAQITEIRAQIARTETFRGYRSLTVAVSGLLATAAGVLQAVLVPEPQQDPSGYLALWVSAAAIGLIVTGVEMGIRCYHAASPWTARLAWLAGEQFLPAVFAGAVLTSVLACVAREALWMLPGLWAILFSLGVFASARLLPRPIFWIGAYYLLAGGACLATADAAWTLSPWMMAGIFGPGQLAAAAILYWKLERNHEHR